MLTKTIHPTHILYLALLDSSIENKSRGLDSLTEDQVDENFDPRASLTKVKSPKLAEFVIERILVY